MALHVRSLALAGGIIWGASIMVLTWIATLVGYGTPFIQFLQSLYVGLDITFVGSLIGLVYGFVDAFIGLYLFALLYNWLEKKSLR